ncbi:hypothetical protein LZZ85_04075 [Terrimonas sp. NA20]|uniref:Uncharacterized protein n=1 Tax=Terrimonas ginsenosidimutans TaxID=2908004 RepID=A0ABS9KMC1_9BACT|nr:hypothetical protein [Terrimonas ginsenosidimutans]MCG2613440.1 hypothetical protein [Terrimonas ginsenosidimutans]
MNAATGKGHAYIFDYAGVDIADGAQNGFSFNSLEYLPLLEVRLDMQVLSSVPVSVEWQLEMMVWGLELLVVMQVG